MLGAVVQIAISLAAIGSAVVVVGPQQPSSQPSQTISLNQFLPSRYTQRGPTKIDAQKLLDLAQEGPIKRSHHKIPPLFDHIEKQARSVTIPNPSSASTSAGVVNQTVDSYKKEIKSNEKTIAHAIERPKTANIKNIKIELANVDDDSDFIAEEEQQSEADENEYTASSSENSWDALSDIISPDYTPQAFFHETNQRKSPRESFDICWKLKPKTRRNHTSVYSNLLVELVETEVSNTDQQTLASDEQARRSQLHNDISTAADQLQQTNAELARNAQQQFILREQQARDTLGQAWTDELPNLWAYHQAQRVNLTEQQARTQLEQQALNTQQFTQAYQDMQHAQQQQFAAGQQTLASDEQAQRSQLHNNISTAADQLQQANVELARKAQQQFILREQQTRDALGQAWADELPYFAIIQQQLKTWNKQFAAAKKTLASTEQARRSQLHNDISTAADQLQQTNAELARNAQQKFTQREEKERTTAWQDRINQLLTTIQDFESGSRNTLYQQQAQHISELQKQKFATQRKQLEQHEEQARTQLEQQALNTQQFTQAYQDIQHAQQLQLNTDQQTLASDEQTQRSQLHNNISTAADQLQQANAELARNAQQQFILREQQTRDALGQAWADELPYFAIIQQQLKTWNQQFAAAKQTLASDEQARRSQLHNDISTAADQLQQANAELARNAQQQFILREQQTRDALGQAWTDELPNLWAYHQAQRVNLTEQQARTQLEQQALNTQQFTQAYQDIQHAQQLQFSAGQQALASDEQAQRSQLHNDISTAADQLQQTNAELARNAQQQFILREQQARDTLGQAWTDELPNLWAYHQAQRVNLTEQQARTQLEQQALNTQQFTQAYQDMQHAQQLQFNTDQQTLASTEQAQRSQLHNDISTAADQLQQANAELARNAQQQFILREQQTRDALGQAWADELPYFAIIQQQLKTWNKQFAAAKQTLASTEQARRSQLHNDISTAADQLQQTNAELARNAQQKFTQREEKERTTAWQDRINQLLTTIQDFESGSRNTLYQQQAQHISELQKQKFATQRKQLEQHEEQARTQLEQQALNTQQFTQAYQDIQHAQQLQFSAGQQALASDEQARRSQLHNDISTAADQLQQTNAELARNAQQQFILREQQARDTLGQAWTDELPNLWAYHQAQRVNLTEQQARTQLEQQALNTQQFTQAYQDMQHAQQQQFAAGQQTLASDEQAQRSQLHNNISTAADQLQQANAELARKAQQQFILREQQTRDALGQAWADELPYFAIIQQQLKTWNKQFAAAKKTLALTEQARRSQLHNDISTAADQLQQANAELARNAQQQFILREQQTRDALGQAWADELPYFAIIQQQLKTWNKQFAAAKKTLASTEQARRSQLHNDISTAADQLQQTNAELARNAQQKFTQREEKERTTAWQDRINQLLTTIQDFESGSRNTLYQQQAQHISELQKQKFATQRKQLEQHEEQARTQLEQQALNTQQFTQAYQDIQHAQQLQLNTDQQTLASDEQTQRSQLHNNISTAADQLQQANAELARNAQQQFILREQQTRDALGQAWADELPYFAIIQQQLKTWNQQFAAAKQTLASDEQARRSQLHNDISTAADQLQQANAELARNAQQQFILREQQTRDALGQAWTDELPNLWAYHQAQRVNLTEQQARTQLEQQALNTQQFTQAYQDIQHAQQLQFSAGQQALASDEQAQRSQLHNDISTAADQLQQTNAELARNAQQQFILREQQARDTLGQAWTDELPNLWAYHQAQRVNLTEQQARTQLEQQALNTQQFTQAYQDMQHAQQLQFNTDQQTLASTEQAQRSQLHNDISTAADQLQQANAELARNAQQKFTQREEKERTTAWQDRINQLLTTIQDFESGSRNTLYQQQAQHISELQKQKFATQRKQLEQHEEQVRTQLEQQALNTQQFTQAYQDIQHAQQLQFNTDQQTLASDEQTQRSQLHNNISTAADQLQQANAELARNAQQQFILREQQTRDALGQAWADELPYFAIIQQQLKTWNKQFAAAKKTLASDEQARRSQLHNDISTAADQLQQANAELARNAQQQFTQREEKERTTAWQDRINQLLTTIQDFESGSRNTLYQQQVQHISELQKQKFATQRKQLEQHEEQARTQLEQQALNTQQFTQAYQDMQYAQQQQFAAGQQTLASDEQTQRSELADNSTTELESIWRQHKDQLHVIQFNKLEEQARGKAQQEWKESLQENWVIFLLASNKNTIQYLNKEIVATETNSLEKGVKLSSGTSTETNSLEKGVKLSSGTSTETNSLEKGVKLSSGTSTETNSLEKGVKLSSGTSTETNSLEKGVKLSSGTSTETNSLEKGVKLSSGTSTETNSLEKGVKLSSGTSTETNSLEKGVKLSSGTSTEDNLTEKPETPKDSFKTPDYLCEASLEDLCSAPLNESDSFYEDADIFDILNGPVKPVPTANCTWDCEEMCPDLNNLSKQLEGHRAAACRIGRERGMEAPSDWANGSEEDPIVLKHLASTSVRKQPWTGQDRPSTPPRQRTGLGNLPLSAGNTPGRTSQKARPHTPVITSASTNNSPNSENINPSQKASPSPKKPLGYSQANSNDLFGNRPVPPIAGFANVASEDNAAALEDGALIETPRDTPRAPSGGLTSGEPTRKHSGLGEKPTYITPRGLTSRTPTAPLSKLSDKMPEPGQALEPAPKPGFFSRMNPFRKKEVLDNHP